jgi:hypothetical protein
MLLGIFIRTSPQWAALISLGCALAMSVVNFVVDSPFQVIVFTNFGVGAYAYFAATLFAPAAGAYKKRVEMFFAVMHKPVDFDKEVGGAVDTQQLRAIGVTSLVITAFILVLMVLVPGDHGWAPFLFIAGFVGTVGGLFLIASRTLVDAGSGGGETAPRTHEELLEEVRS